MIPLSRARALLIDISNIHRQGLRFWSIRCSESSNVCNCRNLVCFGTVCDMLFFNNAFSNSLMFDVGVHRMSRLRLSCFSTMPLAIHRFLRLMGVAWKGCDLSYFPTMSLAIHRSWRFMGVAWTDSDLHFVSTSLANRWFWSWRLSYGQGLFLDVWVMSMSLLTFESPVVRRILKCVIVVN